VSLVLAAALAEALVRLVAPQQLIQVRPDIWVTDDGLGWIKRPNLRTTINTGERIVDLFTDGEGFRVGAGGPVRANTRVLLIGDSFVEALQVPYEQSFAGRLQQLMPALVGYPVAVLNGGTDGYDPNQYLISLRRILARDTVQLVLVGIYLGNDVVDVQMQHFAPRSPAERHQLRFPRSLTWHELIKSVFCPINDALETRSHFFVLLKNRLQSQLMRVGLTSAYFPNGLRKDRVNSTAWTVTAEICRAIWEQAAQHGSAALFILLPAPYQVETKTFEMYVRGFGIDSTTVDLEQPDRLLGRTLDLFRVPFVDLLSDFRAAAAEGPALYGTVDRHLTPWGNEVLTRLVAPRAARELARRAPR
jgi:hypothetical protein